MSLGRLCRLGLNVFSVQLNEMAPGLEAKLPPTDTRRRRDLRALEKGDYAKACQPYPATCRSMCTVASLESFAHTLLQTTLSHVISGTL